MVWRGGHRSTWPHGAVIPMLQRIEAEAGLSWTRGDRRTVQRWRKWMAGLVEGERTVRHRGWAKGHSLRFQVALWRDGHYGWRGSRWLQIRIWARCDGQQIVRDWGMKSLTRDSRRYARRGLESERCLWFYIRLNFPVFHKSIVTNSQSPILKFLLISSP